MDLTFLITLLLVFIIAAIGAALKTLSLDKCLADFDDYNVTLEEKNGKMVWGCLKVYSAGLELFYEQPNVDRKGHIESSYILYRDQFSTMQTIYRIPDELSAENKKRRLENLRRAYKPSFFSRMWRKTRNLLNTLRDAFMQAVGLALGKMKGSSPGAVISKTEKQIATLSQDVIGYAGNAYDPILERHNHRRIVLEITKDGQTAEYAGLLVEYSSNFLEVLDVKYKKESTIALSRTNGAQINEPWAKDISLVIEQDTLIVKNRGKREILIKGFIAEGNEQQLEMTVDPGSSAEMAVDQGQASDLQLIIVREFEVDLIVPRSHALIRHSAEELYFGQPKSGKTAIDSFFEKFHISDSGD